MNANNNNDKDNKQTITDTNPPGSDIIIPLIVLILLIVFIGWMLYLLVSSGFASTNPDNPVTTDKRSNTDIICPAGQCATNLLTGVKTCPVGDIAIAINPAESVCNSRFVCDNPLTPFAVQSDGSTNISGVCEPNVECPCLKISQCAEYILSVFTTSNGNPYQPFVGQRLTFPQQTTYVNQGGVATDVPPIQFNDPATVFCATPPSWLPLSNPGCNFVSATTPNAITYSDILLCTGQINGCSGLTGSPCLQGVLAAISSNPDTLNQSNILQTQFGCVRGDACPCGFLPIFDTNFGGIVCRQLPIT